MSTRDFDPIIPPNNNPYFKPSESVGDEKPDAQFNPATGEATYPKRPRVSGEVVPKFESVGCDVVVRNISDDFAKTLEMNYKEPNEFYTVSDENKQVGDDVVGNRKETLQELMNLVRFGWNSAADKILTYCNGNKVTPQFTEFLMSMLNDENKEAFIYEKFEAQFPGAASRQPEIDALKKRVEELEFENNVLKTMNEI